MSHVSHESNLETVASLWFPLDCRYCGASSAVIGGTAKLHWVCEWSKV
jgi:hypothetical protein